MSCWEYYLPTCGFKWIDPKEFELNKYTRKSSKGCVLEVDLEHPKQWLESHNDHPWAPDTDFYSIPIGIVKKLVPNFFDKEQSALLWKLASLLETRIKTEKNYIVS